MISIRFLRHLKRVHILVLILIALLVVLAVPFLLSSRVFHPQTVAQCVQSLRQAHPGLTDIDVSSCDPAAFVSFSNLSSKEQAANKSNWQIESNAVKSGDASLCNQIQGNMYIAYPPNLTKALKLNPANAITYCRNLVQIRIQHDASSQNLH